MRNYITDPITEQHPLEGFASPGYTQIPDELLDWIIPTLTPIETKVVLYIARRTLGFRKQADKISISQMVNGIVKKDGTRLDLGTGLSRSSVIRALQSLTAKGIITVRKEPTENGDSEINLYALNMLDEAPEGGMSARHIGSVSVTLPGSVTETLGVVSARHPQETVAQETVQQETGQETVRKNGRTEIWKKAQAILEVQMTKAYFDSLVRPSDLAIRPDGTFVITAETVFAKEALETRFANLIQSSLAEAGASVKGLEFTYNAKRAGA